MGPPVHDLLRRLDHLSDQFRELREGFAKAVHIADEGPEMALTRARKVLELVVRDVYERHCKAPPGTQPLEGLIQRLVKDGHFPRRVAAYANAVRDLGNVGTHVFGEKVTPADVYQSLTQLMPVLEWYFESERPEALGGPSAADRKAPPSPATVPVSGPAVSPRRRWPRPIWLAGGVGGLAVLVGLVVLLVRSGQPDQEADGPPGSFQGSYVERSGTKTTLDSVLPLHTEDKLHLECVLPAKVQVAAFWLDTEGKLQKLTRATVAGSRLHFPAVGSVVPLTGPPGTEFVLVVGGQQGRPSQEEVAAALGSSRLPPLPNDVKAVRLGPDGVRVENQRGFGEEEPGVTSSVVERLEALRKELQGRYEFVAGLAFPHR